MISKKTPPQDIILKLKTNKTPIIKMNQIHSNNIHIITTKPTKNLTTIPNVDGLITHLPNLALCVKFADCMPIIISHPSTNYLCILHAGRKGTLALILQKALQQLKKLTASKIDFHIWFGPHISEPCFEINRTPSQHFNLIKKNISQLKNELSLTKNNLSITSECTKCSSIYYSYRGDNHTKKRNYLLCST